MSDRFWEIVERVGFPIFVTNGNDGFPWARAPQHRFGGDAEAPAGGLDSRVAKWTVRPGLCPRQRREGAWHVLLWRQRLDRRHSVVYYFKMLYVI